MLTVIKYINDLNGEETTALIDIEKVELITPSERSNKLYNILIGGKSLLMTDIQLNDLGIDPVTLTVLTSAKHPCESYNRNDDFKKFSPDIYENYSTWDNTKFSTSKN